MEKEELLGLVGPYTILSEERKNALYNCARQAISEEILGDFVECGVFNGGSAGILGSILLDSKIPRKVWLFDSFEGLPNPTEEDIDSHGEKGKKGEFSGSMSKVKELLFEKIGLKQNQVEIIKGWYESTIPSSNEGISKIAVFHLDCDFYEPAKLCLNYFFDKIQKGGFLIIDDYGRWKGCKKAIDEFFAERGIKPNLKESDYTGRYYQKE